jgi:TPR repeat protein
VRALREKAEFGDAKAMSDLGATYYQGVELPRDYPTAFKWFERSSRAGYTLAFVNMATCYREGHGVPKDEKKALECYEVVAEEDTEAMELLGEIHMNGNCGTAKDPREGAYWFRRGAEAGSLECSYRWGVCCATGTGAERDFGNAAEAFRFAAERGHAGAALDLGHCLMNGLGIIGGPKRSTAVEAYTQAAEGWGHRGGVPPGMRVAPR